MTIESMTISDLKAVMALLSSEDSIKTPKTEGSCGI